jgi:hypothetical protein
MTRLVVKRESLGINTKHTSPSYLDGNGEQVLVGTKHPLPTEDHFSANLHLGNAYSFGAVNDFANELGDGDSLDIAIAFGANTEANISIEGLCGGNAEGFLYENAVATGGTAGTAVNLNRNSTNTSNSAITVNPTVTSTGTLLGKYLIMGGTGKKAAGGDMAGSSLIAKPLTNYLLRLTNVDNTDHVAEIIITWFEQEL